MIEKDVYGVGDVVAYELLERGSCWQWAVGRIVRKPTPRIVELAQWHPKEKLLSDAERRRKEEMAGEIRAKTLAVEHERREADELGKQLESDAVSVASTRRVTEANIAKLQPVLDAAKRGLSSIKDEHLRELRSYPTPPATVKKVLEAVMLCFNAVPSTWTIIREFVRRDDFIAVIRDFDPNAMSEDTRLKLTNNYARDPAFTFENAQRASRAAGPLLQWVLAQLEFANIMKHVRPQQAELERLTRLQQVNEQRVRELRRHAAALEGELARARREYDVLLFGAATCEDEDAPPRASRFRDFIPGSAPPTLLFILHSAILRALPTSFIGVEDEDEEVNLTETDVGALIDCAPKASRDYEMEERAARLARDAEALEEEMLERQLELGVEREDNRRQRERVLELEGALGAAQKAADAATASEARVRADTAAAVEQATRRADAAEARAAKQLAAAEQQHQHVLNSATAASEIRKDADTARLAALAKEAETLRQKLREAEQRCTAVKMENRDREEAAQQRLHRVVLSESEVQEKKARELLEAAEGDARQLLAQLMLEFRPPPAAPLVVADVSLPQPKLSTYDKETQTEAEVELADAARSSPPTPPPPAPAAESPSEIVEEPSDPIVEANEEDEEEEEEEEEDFIMVEELQDAARFLIAAFEVIKVVPNKLFGANGKRLQRTWVIDQMQSKFHNLNDTATRVSKSYHSTQLIMLEKSFENPLKLNLLFFGQEHNHELLFTTPYTRERFYELAQAMRTTVVMHAPLLVKEEFRDSPYVKATIDAGRGITLSDPLGNVRTITGRCSINASATLTEDVRIWVGAHNWGGRAPTADPQQLAAWMPRTGEFDLYAIGIIDAPQRAGGGGGGGASGSAAAAAWTPMFQTFLGPHYQVVAPISLATMTLVIFARSKLLPKISAVEGAQVRTSGSDATLGACGVVFRVFDVDFCFVCVKLSRGRGEAADAQREQEFSSICRSLSFSICEGEFTNQFNHVFLFGDFGFPMAEEAPAALGALLDASDFAGMAGMDELLRTREERGFLSAFEEQPIGFAPTAFTEDGPLYLTRVFHRSVEKELKCFKALRYAAAEELRSSEYNAVSSYCAVRLPRPSLACMQPCQAPVPAIDILFVEVAEATSGAIGKPVLLLYAPFSAANIFRCMSADTNTATPRWSGTEDGVANEGDAEERVRARAASPGSSTPTLIPPLEALTQVMRAVDFRHIHIVIKDDAVPKAKHGHTVGTACLPLRHRLSRQLEGVVQKFDCDIVSGGAVVGALTGAMRWRPSHVGEQLLTKGVNITSVSL